MCGVWVRNSMHVPQGIEARAELEELLSVRRNFITPQSNRPVMGIIQDALVGSYLLTMPGRWFPRDEFLNALMHVGDWDGHIPIPAILAPEALWSGKQLMSMVLPRMEYELFDGDADEPLLSNKTVLVRHGELILGRFTKKQLGCSYNSVVHLIWKRFGEDRLAKFINTIQKLVNYWLMQHSFSTGISDCVASHDADTTIVTNALERVHKTITENLHDIEHPVVERTINQILNRARDLAGEDQLKHLPPNHGMKTMVEAGSKGNLINICQINACVGQQNVNGTRIAFNSCGERTLPHFHQHDYGPESKGFVRSSYITGLNPREFFFHAQAGREGRSVWVAPPPSFEETVCFDS